MYLTLLILLLCIVYVSLKYKTAIAKFSNDSASIAYNNVHITTQLIRLVLAV